MDKIKLSKSEYYDRVTFSFQNIENNIIDSWRLTENELQQLKNYNLGYTLKLIEYKNKRYLLTETNFNLWRGVDVTGKDFRYSDNRSLFNFFRLKYGA